MVEKIIRAMTGKIVIILNFARLKVNRWGGWKRRKVWFIRKPPKHGFLISVYVTKYVSTEVLIDQLYYLKRKKKKKAKKKMGVIECIIQTMNQNANIFLIFRLA